MAVQEPGSTGSRVELTFEVCDPELFFVRAAGAIGCRVALAEMVHRSDGRLLEYFTIEGASAEQVLRAGESAPEIDAARAIREAADELLVEFVVSGPCIGGTLADAGAIVRRVEALDGVGTVVADVPPHASASEAVALVDERHDADLLAHSQRDRSAPDFTGQAFRARLVELLTDRQLESLRTAYAGGYFDWPRESTARECADALGVSQPTFTEHLRTAQRKLLIALFDEHVADGTPATPASSHAPPSR